MALLNKLEVRTLVRNLIDDPAGKLWPNGPLDLLAEGSLDELWGELLDQFPWLRSDESAALVPLAPGYIDIPTQLVRFYRVQHVIRGNVEYSPVAQRDVLTVGSLSIEATDQTYTLFGGQLHLFPYDPTTPVYIRYSSLPTAFTDLTPGPNPGSEEDDAISFIEWPDGHHMAYIYDIASKAIEKGDREESIKLKGRADTSLFRLMAYLRKQHSGIIVGGFHEDAFQWGGV